MWVTGSEQTINVYRNLEEVYFNPREILLGIQDFSGKSKYNCGGNSKRTGILSGDWRCDWNAAVSW